MKKNLLTLFTICLIAFNLQSQTWAWARAPKGSGDTEGLDIAVDPSGNSFVTGYLMNSTLAFGTTTLVTTGMKTFLAKYDATGNDVWAKTVTGTSDNIAWAVATDMSGNSFITGGYFMGTATFGPITFTNTSSLADIFLVKYDVNGNVLWARNAASAGTETGRGICTDASGNVIITGEFSAPTITFGTYTLTNTGMRSVFIVKYDVNGNVLWATNSNGFGWDIGFDVDTDGSGDVIVTGVFDGPSISFGSFNANNLSSKEDMFVAKFNGSNGNPIWLKTSSSSMGHDRAYSVSSDNLGNSYVTGYYNAFTSSMNCSGFLSKYDVNGNLVWTRFTSTGSSGPYGNIGYSVSSFAGGVLVGGAMSGSSIALGTTTISVPTYIDPVYLAHYDQMGNLVYAKAIISGGDDNFGVAMDNNCNLFVASDFLASTYVLGNDSLQNTGGESIFIAKMDYSCQGPQGMNYLVVGESNFSVYPNPTNSMLFVRYEHVEWAEIKITNILGEIVLEQAFSEWVDVSKLDPGCYFISIGNHNTKFIKE